MNKHLRSVVLFSFVLLGMLATTKAQSPVVEYHFHNGTYYDLAGSNFHLTPKGAVATADDSAGNPNSAVELTGGFLELGDVDQLEFANGEITIALWVNMESITDWTALVNKWDGVAGGYYLGVNPQNNRLRFNAFVDNVEDTAPMPYGVWTHFAVSYDGTTIKLFRNGVLANQKLATGSLFPNEVSFRIGKQSDFPTSLAYAGSMDEIVVFGEALSDQGVMDIYNNGFPTYANDVALVRLNSAPYSPAPNDVEVKGTLFNIGTETVTNFNLTWTDGTTSFDNQITGVSIAPYEEYEFTAPDLLAILVGETKSIEITAELPNGQADDNSANNTISGDILGVDFIPEKKVFVEEATGTWCQWCPRGDVGMAHMTDTYPDQFVGVSFHFDDPMEIPNYFTDFMVFPDSRVDRSLMGIDPYIENLELSMESRLGDVVKASIEQEVIYDPMTREITVNLSSRVAIPLSGDHRYNLYIVENGVTGEGIDYAQVNAYAGGANGPMGGFENLPNPVPAEDMVYNHVAREVLGAFLGTMNSLPSSMDIGEIYTYTYTYTLPEEYEESEIQLVSTIISIAENQVLNTESTMLSDAMIISDVDYVFAKDLVYVFPNPATNWTNIQISLEESSEVQLHVINSLGQTVAERNYGTLSGEMILPFDTHQLTDGTYFLHLAVGEKRTVEKVVVARKRK